MIGYGKFHLMLVGKTSPGEDYAVQIEHESDSELRLKFEIIPDVPAARLCGAPEPAADSFEVCVNRDEALLIGRALIAFGQTLMSDEEMVSGLLTTGD